MVQSLITCGFDIILNPFRVDPAAVYADDGCLTAEERVFRVAQFRFHSTSSNSLDNRRGVLRCNMLVEQTAGFNAHQRPLATSAHTSHPPYFDPVRPALTRSRSFNCLFD